mgnify:CR=1 FL=1
MARLSKDVYFAKIKDSTELAVDLEELAKEVSLKGIFVKKMLEKIENASPEEQTTFKNALKIGLSSFRKEVLFNDN